MLITEEYNMHVKESLKSLAKRKKKGKEKEKARGKQVHVKHKRKHMTMKEHHSKMTESRN